MGMKKSTFTRNAWSMLRMALVWARKGGALKHARQIKWLQASSSRNHSDGIRYGERQLSFDETPAFRFRMHRPASLCWISCVDPSVGFDDIEERDYFEWSKEDHVCQDDNIEEEVVTDYDDCSESASELVSEEDEEEQEIDSKAEKFIGQFYAQMKLQRQISLLQYDEMLDRSIS